MPPAGACIPVLLRGKGGPARVSQNVECINIALSEGVLSRLIRKKGDRISGTGSG